jgi:hypothetical protein
MQTRARFTRREPRRRLIWTVDCPAAIAACGGRDRRLLVAQCDRNAMSTGSVWVAQRAAAYSAS